jgi:hypothetical protein
VQFRKGTWVTDKESVDTFIERLEICLRSSVMDGNDAARELLDYVTKNRAYNHNQMHMLDALEYEVQLNEKNDLPF